MTKIIALYAVLFLMVTGSAFGQANDKNMPRIIEKDGHHTFLVDGRPFLMFGAQAHNSSAWPGMMPQVWAAVDLMHNNTVELPIYWEQIEPAPGKFDFSVVDTLLTQARQHHVHLVLLWFATWKNGSNHYMPEWMKHDALKYPNITGKDGQPVDSPSPHSKATLDADTKAFIMVMKHLKEADARHTVIMMQVENESGAWGSVRDYSAAAQQLFDGPVPAAMLKPELLTALHVPVVTTGSWKQVFGDRADEYFHAWYVAGYIGQVAAAGKAVYPLPMYANVALRDPITNPTANNYESGGPTDNVIPIWKVAAPALDLLAPDIYLPEYVKVMKVIDLYDRPDNTLFVPEAALSQDNAKYIYEVIARGGIGFSPFGFDDNGRGSTTTELAERLTPFSQEYVALTPMMRELAEWGFEGKIKSVIEAPDAAEQTIDLGAWKAVVSFGGERGGPPHTDAKPIGHVMIVKLDENDFVAIGVRCHITFTPTGSNTGKAWQYLTVEEGRYDNGTFKMLRVLNGDETDWGGPRFGAKPTVLHISLVTR